MSYKEEFISRTRELYQEEVIAKGVRDHTHSILEEYFNSLIEALKKEIAATRGAIDIKKESRRYTVISGGGALEIVNHGDKIQVSAPRPDFNFTDELRYTDQGYYSDKFGEYLSEDLLNQYLKEAFDHTF